MNTQRHHLDLRPFPRPESMLRWEKDPRPVIDAAINRREVAAIALQFDAGLRGGEVTQVQVDDFSATRTVCK